MITSGTYKDGQKNGYGEMYFTDGAYLKTNWVDGKQNGEGVIKIKGSEVEEKVKWVNGIIVND